MQFKDFDYKKEAGKIIENFKASIEKNNLPALELKPEHETSLVFFAAFVMKSLGEKAYSYGFEAGLEHSRQEAIKAGEARAKLIKETSENLKKPQS